MRTQSIALGSMLCVLVMAAPSLEARNLSFDERVAAQRAIEEVYWKHRIWPSENPEPKPPLSEILSDETIRVRVEDDLKKSTALATLWQRSITAHQLQAEMDRMAAQTRDPRLLQELFDALGNDPSVIAESLARPALADRLLRNRYGYDERFHGGLREIANAALAACHDVACMKSIGGQYSETIWQLRDKQADSPSEVPGDRTVQLGADDWKTHLSQLARKLGGDPYVLPIRRLSGLEETPEAFVITAVLSQSPDELVTATTVWRKSSFDKWWTAKRSTLDSRVLDVPGPFTLPDLALVACVDDTWMPTRLDVPDGRYRHTAVWTGTEMIVWGGIDGASLKRNTGGRYNPATDTWVATPTGTNVPAARDHHGAVWTGTEMIVWGGSSNNNNPLSTGARYSPTTNTWTATSLSANVPQGRSHHTLVWTGMEMIVWGGSGIPSILNTGGRYNPSSNTWTATSTGANTPSARSNHTAVWTGTEMVVWGSDNLENTGGRYNPVSDTWIPTSVGTDVPQGRTFHTAIWTGTEMIVWGGAIAGGYVNTGGRYDPSTDTWTSTSTGANVPNARSDHTAVWSGSEMIVWGGGTGGVTGGRYAPSTDTWAATSTGASHPAARLEHTAVWTGAEMIVWGGYSGGLTSDTGARYDPSTDTWVVTSTGALHPDARRDHTAVWTGTEMIVWGGYAGPIGFVNTGGRYTPATDTWTATSIGAGVPFARRSHTAVWTGTMMIVWGGYDGLSTGGRYNVATDTWTGTSSGPTSVYAHTAVWTGTEMIIWGGRTSANTVVNSGGRYNPSSNLWTSTSVTGSVPAARSNHAAVWTSTEMIVWGGANSQGSGLASGGRYNPSTNTWTQVPTTGAPAARSDLSAVWTGTEMIVWGGTVLNTGGRYKPSTNTWTSTSIGANVPSGRLSHTAVWTGTEMIVWGGFVDVSTTTNTGGRYNPSTNTWIATSMGADVPAERYLHTGVWTGREMIIWGGNPITATGGLYCACPNGQVVYRDIDSDGYGNLGNSIASCDGTIPAGYVVNGGDCNDGNPAINPGSSDTSCNGIDDNCSGAVDEGFLSHPTSCGVGACANTGVASCVGGVEQDSCTPFGPSVEVCNGVDDDCDGPVDDGVDFDGDQHFGCGGPDCNDADATVYLGAPELNDGNDNQCPGENGYGIIDEIEGALEIGLGGVVCWSDSSGATSYELARSSSPNFDPCAIIGTAAVSDPCVTAALDPPLGEVFYYLVRATDTYLGSWGQDSQGNEHMLLCTGP